MISGVTPYILYLAAVTVSFAVSVYTVRKVLFITTKRKIYDIPDDTRKIHGPGIPSLGGIGIFTGYILGAAWFMYYVDNMDWFFVIASSVILFFTGVYDDLMNMRPSKKLLAQLIASFIAVYFADVRITSLYGIAGIEELPYWVSVITTTLACTFFINVFNFIDGIDGLAGVTGVLYTALLGSLFVIQGEAGLAGISFSLCGATVGLLFFNFAPAKIYMGDTGSMLLGFTVFILSVLLVHYYPFAGGSHTALFIHSARGAFIIACAILYLPVYDGIRVFILRASKGISPLKADRTHLHYYLLDAGFTHSQSVFIIVITNLLLIILAFVLQDANPYITLLSITACASAMLFIVYKLRQKKLTP